MKKVLSALSLGALVFFAWVFQVGAATTATVAATVTVQNVSVTVSDGSISYGTLAASGTQTTLSGGVNDMQTVTNNVNVTEDINVQGSNSANWTLAATAGSDQYFQKFCNDTDADCSTAPTNYTALTTSYQALDTSIAASGTVDFQLQVGVPSSSTNYTSQSVNVTVQAVAS